jgi:hypothetical protein
MSVRHLFRAFKQNLGGQKRKDRVMETAVTRWLITKNTD